MRQAADVLASSVQSRENIMKTFTFTFGQFDKALDAHIMQGK